MPPRQVVDSLLVVGNAQKAAGRHCCFSVGGATQRTQDERADKRTGQVLLLLPLQPEAQAAAAAAADRALLEGVRSAEEQQNNVCMCVSQRAYHYRADRAISAQLRACGHQTRRALLDTRNASSRRSPLSSR